VVVDVDGVVDVYGDVIVYGIRRRNRFVLRSIRAGSQFSKMDVYQRATQFLAHVYDIVDAIPRGHADRCDQLVRAAESVLRNIAEGAGRWATADSVNRYKISRGEAMECAAAMDVMRLRKLVSQERYDEGMRLLEAIVAMLTKLIAT
jgi:four helix bundle protein